MLTDLACHVRRLLAATLCLWAIAGHGAGLIDHYDAASGLYYRTLTEQQLPSGLVASFEPKTVIINLNIFDPATETSTRFFKDAIDGEITEVLFETGLTDGRIDVISLGGGWRLKHNAHLPEDRSPRDRLLVGVREAKSGATTLYVADKHGADPKVLVVVPREADWHIDAANGKLRVVRRDGDGVAIDSYDW